MQKTKKLLPNISRSGIPKLGLETERQILLRRDRRCRRRLLRPRFRDGRLLEGVAAVLTAGLVLPLACLVHRRHGLNHHGVHAGACGSALPLSALLLADASGARPERSAPPPAGWGGGRGRGGGGDGDRGEDGGGGGGGVKAWGEEEAGVKAQVEEAGVKALGEEEEAGVKVRGRGQVVRGGEEGGLKAWGRGREVVGGEREVEVKARDRGQEVVGDGGEAGSGGGEEALERGGAGRRGRSDAGRPGRSDVGRRGRRGTGGGEQPCRQRRGGERCLLRIEFRSKRIREAGLTTHPFHQLRHIGDPICHHRGRRGAGGGGRPCQQRRGGGERPCRQRRGGDRCLLRIAFRSQERREVGLTILLCQDIVEHGAVEPGGVCRIPGDAVGRHIQVGMSADEVWRRKKEE